MSNSGLLGLLSRLNILKVDFRSIKEWVEPDSPDSAGERIQYPISPMEPSDVVNGNAVGSARTDLNRLERHAVAIDIDVPAWLIPSSTPGHSHLYADVECKWEDYLAFLRAAKKIGLVEPGYVLASEARGETVLRLPWVKKEGV